MVSLVLISWRHGCATFGTIRFSRTLPSRWINLYDARLASTKVPVVVGPNAEKNYKSGYGMSQRRLRNAINTAPGTSDKTKMLAIGL